MSNNVRKGQDLLGLPVFSVDEGARLGEITGLLVGPADSYIAGVQIGTGDRLKHVIPFRKLRTIGSDIVLIDEAAALQELMPDVEVQKLEMGLSGRPVITQSGEKIGTVTGFSLNTEDGAIKTYSIKPEMGLMERLAATVIDRGLEIAAVDVHSVGPNALIVSDTALRSDAE